MRLTSCHDRIAWFYTVSGSCTGSLVDRFARFICAQAVLVGSAPARAPLCMLLHTRSSFICAPVFTRMPRTAVRGSANDAIWFSLVLVSGSRALRTTHHAAAPRNDAAAHFCCCSFGRSVRVTGGSDGRWVRSVSLMGSLVVCLFVVLPVSS